MLENITIVYYFIDFWIWGVYDIVMKRSQILYELQMLIATTDAYTAPVDYYLDSEKLAKEILKEIEELGMLPPLNEKNYHHMDNDSRETVNQAKWYFSWEEE